MEAVLASMFEKSIVYGAFLWLLYHVLGDFSKALTENNKTMKEISKTMISFEKRLANLEKKQGDDDSAS